MGVVLNIRVPEMLYISDSAAAAEKADNDRDILKIEPAHGTTFIRREVKSAGSENQKVRVWDIVMTHFRLASRLVS